MSDTFYLVCDETKKKLWIGQGWGSMTNFYSGEKETMELLKRFLNEHISPKTIRFTSYHDDEVMEYECFE